MPRHRLTTAGPGRPKGVPNKATRDVKEFAKKFLSSKAYLESAQERVLKGTAPHLETLWHHYGYGKPKESVQISGDVPPFVLRLERDDSQ